nr:hypothetical protein [Pantoea cypripedii]
MISNDELKPCPFCGGCAWIESNRDWHRLKADHGENCFIGEHEPMYPATDEQRRYLVQDWNQRSKQEGAA